MNLKPWSKIWPVFHHFSPMVSAFNLSQDFKHYSAHSFAHWRSKLFLYLMAIFVLGALSPIFISSFNIDPEVWPHLKSYVLPSAALNTIWLVIFVSLATLLVGVVSGWICSQYEFKGRRLISRLLVVPLAIPAYVLAFVYLGLFDFAGEWRLWLIQYGWANNFYIQGGWGAGFVLTLSLYPYVYLFSYSAFSTQGKRWKEVAQSLGRSRWSSFFEVEWRFCSPWVLSGVALVAMEVAADFGAVVMFNYETLSTSIYKVWFDMHSWVGASQLASGLVLLVFVLRFFKVSKKQKYTSDQRQVCRERAPWLGQILIYLFLVSLISLALIIPIFQLLNWATRFWEGGASVFPHSQHSFILGLLGALLIALLTFLSSYCLRFNRDIFSRLSQRILYLGYALPGTVLAVGVLGGAISLGWNTGQSTFLSLILVLLAYTIRFQPLGLAQLSSAFERLSTHLDESATILGHSSFRLLKKIHFPLVKRAVWGSILLIFIEIVKEMPLTLMLRPFGWDTLAVKIFEFTSEGDWERAAPPALIIVFLGVCASWFVHRSVEESSVS